MQQKVFVFDPTANDPLSKVRGVGRYLQILKENFPEFTFTSDLSKIRPFENPTIFINPFFNFLQRPLVTKKIAQKQIAVIHDLIPLKYPEHFPIGLKGKLNIYLNKLSLKTYDLIITDSEASKKDIEEKLKVQSSNVKVVYPTLPTMFWERYEKKEIGSFCLYVGDATWNKNLVILAKAIKIANVTCVFLGKVFEKSEDTNFFATLDFANAKRIQRRQKNLVSSYHPWQKELKEFLELTKDDKRFIFPGFVSDKQLLEYYRRARLNILVSRDEGFGFSYLEAASQETPSILSNVPVLKEVAKNSVLFANPQDPNDIANAIIELYFDPKKQKQIGQKAKARLEFFSAGKFRKDFLELL